MANLNTGQTSIGSMQSCNAEDKSETTAVDTSDQDNADDSEERDSIEPIAQGQGNAKYWKKGRKGRRKLPQDSSGRLQNEYEMAKSSEGALGDRKQKLNALKDSNACKNVSEVTAKTDCPNSVSSQILPRLSIISFQSRGSVQSDISFWDPHETLPHADHYRSAPSLEESNTLSQRPTLDQLREEQEPLTRSTVGFNDEFEDENIDSESQSVPVVQKSQKKGWIQGVLIRCLLNIFGVMLFLRLTWVTGQAGIALGTVIVLLSSLVTTLTTMSMAAICTNGEVGGGGAYYMISRSLGPEFGGAIGVIFSLANAVAAAMYVIGFAETLRDLVKDEGGVITGDPLHDVRVIGIATSVVLLGIVIIGLDFETKAQIVLFFILFISIVNFIIGTFLPPSEEKRRVGFVGYTGDLFVENLVPDFRQYGGTDYSFFQVFAIFFPAATGILAGANISGDLRNPSTAIPRGTFLAILITTVVYVMIIWMTGACMLRDALGPFLNLATNLTASLDEIGDCQGNVSCSYGLHNWHGLMGTASAFQPLIYAGIFSATISSALASLISAPKIFQALGKDNLFPLIGFFARDYGKDGEPRRGYLLVFVICVGMTCIGSLDAVAPIISNFFLMAYAIINFSCFDAAFANSPGFRPAFRLYNKWVSMAGALVCVVIMFLISWWAALTTMILVAALYIYIKHSRKPDVNWGSSGQAHAYKDALSSTLKLVDVNEHVKNFRPQIMVLTGYPRNRPALVDLAASITQRQSLLMCAQIFQGDMQDHLLHLQSTAAYSWFRERGVRSFYTSMAAPTLRHGTQALLQSQGLGKLCPNTLLLGFKNNWQSADPGSVHNYAGIIHDAFDLHFGVGILRIPGGLNTGKVSDVLLDSTGDNLDDNTSGDEDLSEAGDEDIAFKRRRMSVIFRENNIVSSSVVGKHDLQDYEIAETESITCDSDMDDNISDNGREVKTPREANHANTGTDHALDKYKNNVDFAGCKGDSRSEPHLLSRVLFKDEPETEALNATYFREKRSGTLDVWWLFDDGGLGLLLPYILSTRKKWRECKLRVFCAGTKRTNLEEDRLQMVDLLDKFRIKYSDLTVLPELRQKPSRSNYKEFERLIYQWRLMPGETQDDFPWKVSDGDIISHKQKIYMQIKIREKLLEHSSQAALVVVTLPVPRKFCPAGLYMAWLDTLTRDLPPTLLLRGNQQSVLTYFS